MNPSKIKTKFLYKSKTIQIMKICHTIRSFNPISMKTKKISEFIKLFQLLSYPQKGSNYTLENLQFFNKYNKREKKMNGTKHLWINLIVRLEYNDIIIYRITKQKQPVSLIKLMMEWKTIKEPIQWCDSLISDTIQP